MKVSELLAKLRELDSDLDVLCYSEDEEILRRPHGFRIFDINGIAVREAEKTRTEDGTPSLKFDKTEISSSHVLIEISSDF